MDRFADTLEAVRRGRLDLVPVVELIDVEGAVVASSDPGSADVVPLGAEPGDVTYDPDATSQRAFTLSFGVPEDAAALRIEGPQSLLHPDALTRVRARLGFVLDGVDKVWTLGTFLIGETTQQVLPGGVVAVSLALQDTTRPLRSKIETPFPIAAGEPVEDVVERLLAEVYPSSDWYRVAPTGFATTEAVVEEGQVSRLDIVTDLLEGCGHELTTDSEGRVFSRSIPPTTDDPGLDRWPFGGESGIPVRSSRRVWRAGRPRAWKVTGEAADAAETDISYTAFDTDPASEGYYEGPGEIDIRTRALPYIANRQQAAAAAFGWARRESPGPWMVEFETIPVPGLKESDLVEVTIPGHNLDGAVGRVLSVSMPVSAGEAMKVRARGVFDPAIGTRPAAAAGSGDVASISVDFSAYADGNLENLPGAPGSPLWTEYGWSWGIKGGFAVQRSPGTWSMAVYNTPLETSDQFATILIDRVPAGLSVGPKVRGAGQASGYVALVSAAGVVSLVVVQGNVAIATLGTHNAGGSLAGQEVTVRAVGSTVSARVGGVEVISATDARFSDPFVGFWGLGAPEDGAVRVAEFSAGSAS